MTLNHERLADLFVTLCEIDSPAAKEGVLAARLKEILAPLALEIVEDDSKARTGSDSGNLIVRFPDGGLALEPVFFNCHLDTVEPSGGVRVIREGNRFRSAGDTVLGGDDKSGIAILVEVMRTLREHGIPHGPVEFVFTTSEEVGLLGAKAFDFRQLKAMYGYALDSTGIDRIIIGAPAANRFEVEISGVAAHAGLSPEKGINAIQLAAKAIAGLKLGRLDGESTANIGLIEGGTATNIIPAVVRMKGEVRSHSDHKLEHFTAAIVKSMEESVAAWQDPDGMADGRPAITVSVHQDYPVLKLSVSDPVIRRAAAAAASLGREIDFVVAGGGSDANIFNSYGLPCAILSTGMDKVHSTAETILLDDMVRTAELVMNILTTS